MSILNFFDNYRECVKFFTNFLFLLKIKAFNSKNFSIFYKSL